MKVKWFKTKTAKENIDKNLIPILEKIVLDYPDNNGLSIFWNPSFKDYLVNEPMKYFHISVNVKILNQVKNVAKNFMHAESSRPNPSDNLIYWGTNDALSFEVIEE